MGSERSHRCAGSSVQAKADPPALRLRTTRGSEARTGKAAVAPQRHAAHRPELHNERRASFGKLTGLYRADSRARRLPRGPETPARSVQGPSLAFLPLQTARGTSADVRAHNRSVHSHRSHDSRPRDRDDADSHRRRRDEDRAFERERERERERDRERRYRGSSRDYEYDDRGGAERRRSRAHDEEEEYYRSSKRRRSRSRDHRDSRGHYDDYDRERDRRYDGRRSRREPEYDDRCVRPRPPALPAEC